MNVRFFFVLCFFSAVILSCSTGLKRSGNQYVYVIQPGDTLAKVAYRYRIPAAKLAKWNNISTSTPLQAGKALRMAPSDPIAAQYKQKYHTVKVKQWDTLHSIAFHYGLDTAELAALNGLSEPYSIRTGQTLKLSKYTPAPSSSRPSGLGGSRPSKPNTPVVTGRPVVMPKPMNYAPDSGLSWMWPTKGTLTSRYGKRNKGIDIKGSVGQKIVASSGGKVVYSGNGLPGYGNLIIIKHNDKFLSAYAFNQTLHVKEGQRVSQGQHIADMGRANASEEKLHFEVRYKGRPVNPLKYLPKT